MVKKSRPPTTKDVARLADVSPTTVSYVLNGRHDKEGTISQATRERVLAAVAELGYAPNSAARSLRRQHTERVCLVLPGLGVPYYDALARDLQQAADIYGYSVIIAVADSPERVQQVFGQLQRLLADGAIVSLDESLDEYHLTSLARSGLSLVVITNRLTSKEFDIIGTTEAEACYEAMRHLLMKGHRRIGFLGHTNQITRQSYYYERFDSYLRALHDHGIALDEELICGGASVRAEAYQSTLSLLRLAQPPSSIFAASDIAAISALWAVRDLGLRVPQDIAILGVGNIPEGEITAPPLTTVGPATLDFTEVAHLLFSRLRSEAPLEGRRHLLHWELIVREST